MTGVIRLKHWAIFRMLHPHIWAPPTHFQKMMANFKIDFPGNQTKILISPESA